MEMSNSGTTTVVVTGIGALTPLGMDVMSTWQRLVAGTEAQAPITLFDVSGCRCQSGAQTELPDFAEVNVRRLRRWSRATRLAVPAFREALAMAGLLEADGRSRFPQLTLSVSTTGGAMALGERYVRGLLAGRRGPGRVFEVAHYQAHHQILDLQDQFGFRGPIAIIANACASGANAIGHGADLIRSGRAELVITGGYEPLTELIYVGFDCLQAMSADKCRPFDTARTGLMLGEAAAFLVLESERHARERGANILGVVAGYGHSTDVHHLTQPHPRGAPLVAAIRRALDQAQLTPGDIGYLNAHGTGTLLNDASECVAFAEVFGNSAPLRLSSTKAAVGHTLGAAGAVEAVFALQVLRTGELPPNLNVRQPEPAVAARLVTRGERGHSLQATISVNLGFGGSNTALILTRYEDCASKRPPAHRHISEGRKPPPMAVCGVGMVVPERELRGMASLAGREWPVRRVDLNRPELARWQNEPRLRRASGLTVFMLAAAQQAVDAAGGVNPATLGIVAAFHTGVLVPTGRFYQGVVKHGQRFASPNVFPETVFNSPTSHLAAVLGVVGPSYTVVADDTAWVSALNVATTWLANGLVENVLVVSGEELDPMALDAYAAVRWLRRGGAFVPAEGAGAVVLRRARAGDPVRIVALAEGLTHRSKAQARAAAENLFARFPGVRNVCRTATGTLWERLETELHARHGFVAPLAWPDCGGAFVASAVWYTAWGVQQVRATKRDLLVPIWGHSEQFSASLLAGPSL
jgi:3-oxoacyl-[acyl-carrier-protein] synthase II